MSEIKALDVNIMGREYRIACPVGQEEALRQAVKLVEKKMQDTASHSRNAMPERVAVLTAVNLASDYLEACAGKVEDSGSDTKKTLSACDTEEFRRRIAVMDTRLDAILARG
ncbi:MAG: cell division protein ZapA [Zoogloeaceae bacterium]|nr:cell division protein ZapA [Zoogloeaceae bacterium]